MADLSTETVFRSGRRAPIQKRFANRTPKVRTTATKTTRPSLRLQQSTLTQLDYCSPTPRDSLELDGIYDDTKVVDTPERRRKRRKTEKTGRKQTTLTQIYPLEVPESDGDISSLDEEPAPAIKAANEDEDVPQTPTDGQENRPFSIPETQHLSPSRAPSRNTEQRLDRPSVVPKAMPQTPVKRWKDEIPSSQTPQSIILLSGRSRRDLYSPQRSPLKEKSANRRTQAAGPIRETPSKDLSGLFPIKPIVLNSVCSPKPGEFRKPALPLPRMERVTVGPAQQPRLRLSRTASTVQDSQFDSAEEILLDDLEEDHEQLSILETQRLGYSYDYYSTHPELASTYYFRNANDTQLTFDPACSALDRDAARFMQTQNLLQAHKFPHQEQQDSILDDEVIGVTRRISGHARQSREMTDLARNNDLMMETRDFEEIHRSPSNPHNEGPHETIDLTSTQPPAAVSSSPQNEEGNSSPIKHEAPPSSPPAISPSQATTVDGTQFPPPFEILSRSSPELVSEVISSSPLPHNPSSPQRKGYSSREQRRSSFSLYTSDPAHGIGGMSDEEERGQKWSVKRLKRAREVLPDSLLDFSLPAAPGYKSPRTGVDYSLPPPSSDWRNGGGRER